MTSPSSPASPRSIGPAEQRFNKRAALRSNRNSPASSNSVVLRATPPNAPTFQCFCPCPHGLEEVLVKEVESQQARAVIAGWGGVKCQGDWEAIYRINLYSRIATRVWVEVVTGPYHQLDDVYKLANKVPWEAWATLDQTIKVTTVSRDPAFTSTALASLKVKDGVCDRWRQRGGERPSVDTATPDVRILLYLEEGRATLYIDSSGEGLFKRGWRSEKGEAPLRENLAAGLLALSGWQPGMALLDPMCGAGTFLVEAAQQTLGMAPGLQRALTQDSFAFTKLRPFNASLWQRVCDEARSKIENPPPSSLPIWGSDISGDAIAIARNNLERAGIPPHLVALKQIEAQHVEVPTPRGIVITNPPYGARLDVRGDHELSDEARYLQFFTAFASHLKAMFSDWQVFILSADLDLPRHLRLRESRKTPIFNGNLECRLFRFDMVKGRHPSHHKAGKADLV